MYLLFGLTYFFARCIFQALSIEWISLWLLGTIVADVNSFISLLTSSVVKTLLVLRLRAIWNKDFIGEGARNMDQYTCYTDFFWILVTLILYSMTAGMFCRSWFLIDRANWQSKLAEVLVSFEDSTILDPTMDFFRLRCPWWWVKYMLNQFPQCYPLSMVAGWVHRIFSM